MLLGLAMNLLAGPLDKECYFYNYQLENRRHAYQKRKQRFPTLEHTGRHFNKEEFTFLKMLERIGLAHIKRKVYSNGRVRQHILGKGKK